MKFKFASLLALIILTINVAQAEEIGLRSQFLNNKSIICGINIRNFNAKDTNKNGNDHADT